MTSEGNAGLTALRANLTAIGITADSPDALDADAERLAVEERLTERS